MKRQWSVRRQTMERPDASQRWDRGYQSILRWGMETETHPAPSANGKEDNYAGSGIRPGLDPRTGEASDH
jgi:hypothetical protein